MAKMLKMAKNFNELRNKMSPRSRARAEVATRKMIQQFPLAQLRDAQNITQEELARRLDIDQSAVSKMERRADMYLSTLSDVIRAMGGQLELTARFPGGDVHVIALRATAGADLADAERVADKSKHHSTVMRIKRAMRGQAE